MNEGDHFAIYKEMLRLSTFHFMKAHRIVLFVIGFYYKFIGIVINN